MDLMVEPAGQVLSDEQFKSELRRVFALEQAATTRRQRMLKEAERRGIRQREIAPLAGVTQGAISQQMARAREVADPRPGFSGATLTEEIELVVAGVLSREQAVDELSRWDYIKPDDGDPDNPWLHEFDMTPGSWRELEQALMMHKIDVELYEEIRLARKSRK